MSKGKVVTMFYYCIAFLISCVNITAMFTVNSLKIALKYKLLKRFVLTIKC